MQLKDIWGEIFEKSFIWEQDKYSKKFEAQVSQLESRRIMNNLSNLYLKGVSPIFIWHNVAAHNVILYYNKKSKEYRYKHCIFLFYNTVRKFYSKFPGNSIAEHQLREHSYLREFYFEKLTSRNSKILEKDEMLCLQYEKHLTLSIVNSEVFTDKRLLGLTRSLLGYPVYLNDQELTSYRVYQIAKKYLLSNKYLDLHELDIEDKDLSWWFHLPINALNISDTNVSSLVFPELWHTMELLYCKNLKLTNSDPINNLGQLKDLDLSGIESNNFFSRLEKLPDYVSIDLAHCKLSNEKLPEFLWKTTFTDIYLDYNELVSADFIKDITFSSLDISNNPIRDNIHQNVKGKVTCNFYFKSESLSKFLCKNGKYLTWDEARTMNQLVISNVKGIDSLDGIENLPFLESIKISAFHIPLLTKSFKNSFLKTFDIETYGLNQLPRLWSFHSYLLHLFHNGVHGDYNQICSSCKGIMKFTSELLDCDYSDKNRYAITIGLPILARYMHINLSDFYKAVVDAFAYACKFWKGDLDEQEKPHRNDGSYYDKLAKTNYKNKLTNISRILDMPVSEINNSEHDLLVFFAEIHKIYDKCIRHDPKEMESIICKELEKNINIHYVYPNGMIL